MNYVVELKDVHKYYGKDTPSEVHVLKGINLRIRKGEFISIMGPSGSGKTTLLDIMGCLLKPTTGHVFIDGIETNRLSDRELARIRGKKIGFVFQQYNLISSLTALENVEIALRINGWSKQEAKRRSHELLEIVGLKRRINHKPSQLSGGEQQRVAIARALANNPKIILADEPTGNLDTKTGFMILKLLKDLNKNNEYTIVIVTHDLRVGKIADKTIKIMDGRIVK